MSDKRSMSPLPHQTRPVRSSVPHWTARATGSAVRRRLLAGLSGSLLLVLAVSAGLSASRESKTAVNSAHVSSAGGESAYRNTSPGVAYVGSGACKDCHRAEYDQYRQTPHAQAASTPENRPELKSLPSKGVTVCPGDGERCFRVFPANGGYFMSQFDRGADGAETHVEVHKIAYTLGKPLMATGYLIQRGDYLFEAPLTYYAFPSMGHASGWGLSPGYENDPLGFARPVIGSCLTCHIGRPRSTGPASNLYKSPPFEELSVGCESCHGPGSLHVRERREHPASAAKVDTSIVNPARLSSQIADETCMYCHELGEARIPQPGRSFQDYRPGVPLLRTQAIFKSKLLLGWNLEEWSDEMAASACYRFSKGAMRCSTCHDAHFTPTGQEAPSFYRAKCLTCHQSSSCTLPLSERERTQPADNCVSCHMPKHVAPKLVKVGGQGTSHRITRIESEPVPQVESPQTTPDPATGMILVDSDSSDAQKRVSQSVLLRAYQSVLAHDPTADLAARYEALLKSMASDAADAIVFSALANQELAKHSDEGNRAAMYDLSEAVRLHTESPKDYLLLSELQFRSNDLEGAIATLTAALERFPYVPTPYENLAVCYLRSNQPARASEVIRRGLEIFPSDKNLLLLSERMHL